MTVSTQMEPNGILCASMYIDPIPGSGEGWYTLILAYGLILHHNRSLRAVVVFLGVALCEIIGTYII